MFREMHNAHQFHSGVYLGDSVLNCKVDDSAWLAVDANNHLPSAPARRPWFKNSGYASTKI